MRILVFGGMQRAQMLRTLCRGLTAAGHEVQHLPFMGELELPSVLTETAQEFQPDFSIGFCIERVSRIPSLEAIRGIPGVRCYWDFDMPQESLRSDVRWLRQIVQCFDFATTVDDSAATAEFFDSCGVDWHWMPPLADEFDPPARYQDELEVAVSIVGSGYSDVQYQGCVHPRADVAFALRAAFGFENVALYGRGWPEGWDRGFLEWDAQFDVYRSAAINVGTFVSVPAGPSRLLNFRPVLCLQAGGFLLQEWHDGIDRCFVPDQEIVYWTTVDELLEKVALYIPDFQARQRIAEAGRRRVSTDYSNVKWGAWLADLGREYADA